MSARVDRILDVLDVGLQGSPEHGYPEATDDPTRCARCLSTPPADGDLCGPCRSFLLGDTDHDPSQPTRRIMPVPGRSFIHFGDPAEPILTVFGTSTHTVQETLEADIAELADLLSATVEARMNAALEVWRPMLDHLTEHVWPRLQEALEPLARHLHELDPKPVSAPPRRTRPVPTEVARARARRTTGPVCRHGAQPDGYCRRCH